jgi:hypothetical protein
MFDPSGYIPASGTSFSGPHVSGSVALVKQAHLGWSPDMIRTALINTATNLRRTDGTSKADGNGADAINDQGAGLIDVGAAVNTKALMGVVGDGIAEPGILGSHSFGEKPILNNRINNTYDVTVTIRDVSGQGGTFNLSTVNNRSTELAGISTSLSQSSVSVPPNGSSSFTASVSLDGNAVRSTDIKQLQWYVVAENGGKKLRMPMYLQATPSLPSDQIASSTTDTYSGTVLAGDAGVQRDNGIYVLDNATFVDVPFTVDASTLKIDGTLNWNITDTGAGVGLPDLDFLLFDPNGNEIASSGNSNTPEHVATNTTIPGTYIYRVYGWANGPTDFTITSTQLRGASAPVVQPFAADLTIGTNKYDFDGNFAVTWQPKGTPEGYEVECSTDGVNWTVVAVKDGNSTGANFDNVADGNYFFRVRAITPGRIGKFVTNPSNVENLTVSHRMAVDATSDISALNRSITFPAGATELVTALKNISSTTYYPNMRFEIVSISSAGNTVKAVNADNGGNGTTTIAAYDYSQLVGNSLAPNAESGNKTLRFSNPNMVLFSFTARVMANALYDGGGTSLGSSTSGSTTGSGSTAGSTSGGTSSAGGTTRLLQFTVNPLTRTVNISLLQ